MPDIAASQQDERGWLTLEEAGTAEGVSRRAVAKKLTKGGYSVDKARRVPGVKGQKWQVHVTALSLEGQARYWEAQSKAALDVKIGGLVDAQSFVPEPPPPPTIAAFMAATGRERAKATRRQAIVEGFRALATTAEKRAYAKAHGLSLAGLYLLNRAYDGTAASLLRRAGRPKNTTNGPRGVRDVAVQLFLQQERPSPAQVYRAVAAQFPDSTPHRATLYRWLTNEAHVNKALACYLRDGKERFRDQFEPVRRRNWNLIPVNDTWVGDHHEFDLLVVTPEGTIKRQWLTAWQDGASRAIIGWVVNFQPNSFQISLALKDGILPKEGSPFCGLPRQLYVDNGRDYRSKLLNGTTIPVFRQSQEDPVWGLLGHLGIGTRFCEPYHGKSKPVERCFGTLEKGWVCLLPGYCGRSPQHRPAHLEADVKATQDWLTSGGARGTRKLLTWWEAEEEFRSIIDAYNNRPHASLHHKTPLEVYSEGRAPAVTIPAREALEVLILPSATRKVRNDGISVTIKGEHRRYWHEALTSLIGQAVEVRWDPRDPADVLVLKGREFVCHAPHQVDVAPFAETEEELTALQEFLAGNAAQRKVYAQKRKALRAVNPLDMMTPMTRPLSDQGGLVAMRAITGFDRAGKAAAAPKPPTDEQAKAVNDLYLFEFQKRDAETQRR